MARPEEPRTPDDARRRLEELAHRHSPDKAADYDAAAAGCRPAQPHRIMARLQCRRLRLRVRAAAAQKWIFWPASVRLPLPPSRLLSGLCSGAGGPT